ncbi:hypothetical protein D3C84_592970 [compost metagenome]
MQQVGHDPADQADEHQHQVVQLVVVQRFFQLQVHQREEGGQAQHEIEQTIEAQYPALLQPQAIRQRMPQQQGQWQQARHDVGGQLAVAQAEKQQRHQ